MFSDVVVVHRVDRTGCSRFVVQERSEFKGRVYHQHFTRTCVGGVQGKFRVLRMFMDSRSHVSLARREVNRPSAKKPLKKHQVVAMPLHRQTRRTASSYKLFFGPVRVNHVKTSLHPCATPLSLEMSSLPRPITRTPSSATSTVGAMCAAAGCC